MCQITIDIPDEVLYDTKMSKTETMDFARKVAEGEEVAVRSICEV